MAGKENSVMLQEILNNEEFFKGKFSDFHHIKHLINDFRWILEQKETEPFQGNEEYMGLMELYYLLKNVRELSDINLFQTYYKADTRTVKGLESDKIEKRSFLDKEILSNQLQLLDKILESLLSYSSARIQAAINMNLTPPRIYVLCAEYNFSLREKELFQLMVVAQGSTNSHVLNSLLEEDYLRKMTAYQRLSGVSEVDIDIFCDGERSHMRENIVTVDEENGTQFNLRVQKVAVQLLYGRKVKADDLLKISQTKLELILLKERNGTIVSPQKKRKLEDLQDEGKEDESGEFNDDNDYEDEDLYDKAPLKRVMSLQKDSARGIPRSIKFARSNSWGPHSQRSHFGVGSPKALDGLSHGKDSSLSHVETADDLDMEEEEASLREDFTVKKSSAILGSDVIAEEDVTNSLKPYDATNQLEYLEDSFQLIALMIKGNVARLKDDLKKEGTSRFSNSWGDGSGDLKHSKRELLAKLKLQESRITSRLRKTEEQGLPLPRLEVLVQRFALDPFEKKIILLLLGKTVSPIVKTLMETLDTSNRVSDDIITVGQALSILCQDFHTQIANRKYFYQSSRLLKNAVISLQKVRWHVGSGDLTENRIVIDRRILDWAVGLDSEINELVEGSDLYEPKVNLAQVVLPQEYVQKILSQCLSYEHFQKFRTNFGLEKNLSYGNSLVILLCGKSGTGKTMTVNAIANELKKKVLLVDFNSLLNKKDSGGSEFEVDLKGLFRESMMNNAIIFFDECETIFKSRNLGSDRVLNSLLTEIERYEGIVFMATNRPYEIDEAMHRRITMVLEYREPDVNMRKLIWDSILGVGNQNAKLPLADDVNTATLAAKYQLTGGFIKNAVLSGLLSALSRDKDTPKVTQIDLIEGCKMQMRGNLIHRAFDDRISNSLNVKHNFQTLFLPELEKKMIKNIIEFENSRAQVYGSWNIVSASEKPSIFCNSHEKGCINLLAGNRGSGKSTIVETIAFELGEKRMKWLHVSDFMTQNFPDVIEVFRALVKDARIMDSIIVIDGFEHILEDSGESGANNTNKLHILLSRIMDILYDGFQGCVFLLAHIENPQNITLQRDFASRLYSFLRLQLPASDLRTCLWKKLIPPKAPLSSDVDFTILGKKFDLFPGSIESAIAHAASQAASRAPENQKITQKDLLSAGEHEIAKFKSGNFEMISKLFT